MIPIYILKRVPGADPADANTVEWEAARKAAVKMAKEMAVAS